MDFTTPTEKSQHTDPKTKKRFITNYSNVQKNGTMRYISIRTMPYYEALLEDGRWEFMNLEALELIAVFLFLGLSPGFNFG